MAENKRDGKTNDPVEQEKPGKAKRDDRPTIFNSSSEYIINIDADLVQAGDRKALVTVAGDGSLQIHVGKLTGGLHTLEERKPATGPAKVVTLNLHLKKP